MAFVEFEKADGRKVLVNLDQVKGVTVADGGGIRVLHSQTEWLDVLGDWEEVIARLGVVTDVCVMEREEVPA